MGMYYVDIHMIHQVHDECPLATIFAEIEADDMTDARSQAVELAIQWCSDHGYAYEDEVYCDIETDW